MTTLTVTTWYLEQTSPDDLRPAADPGEHVRIVRAEVPSAEYSRFLYTAVGVDLRWTDRLGLTREEWQGEISAPGVETWVAYEHGTPAGYVEIAPREDGAVEVVYFGLIAPFRGRRIGGHLLAAGVARAWDLAERWPHLPTTKRVWLHTCSKDSEQALPNYLRRGFALYDTRITEEEALTAPSPWPATRQS